MEGFHPAVVAWFEETFGAPTKPQRDGWPQIGAGRHTLIAAPTGSGKTLAAFLSAIDDLVCQSLSPEGLEEGTQVVYISPLKALSNDVEKNLRQPLDGIRATAAQMGLAPPMISTAVRSGDTVSSKRAAMVKRPPHILVTTPESLYILLTSEGGRRMLGGVKTLIVDEIHAMVPNKRGSHLSLTMERLSELVDGDLLRIGLSATQRPIREVARFLTGGQDCAIVDSGHKRRIDLEIVTTASPLDAIMSAEHMQEVYDRLAQLIRAHTTTLVFTNTRRETERVTRMLCERFDDDSVGAHHGSLSKEHRLDAEQSLKSGRLKALVATASLEMGIDIGSVDLVCQIGSVRTIGTLLQRVGRSGHQLGATPKGRLFPLTRDELVESVALLDAIERGELDELQIPPAPADILAQQLVAMAGCRDWTEAQMLSLVKRAWPYRDIGEEAFSDLLRMLGDGFATRRGRRGAYLHLDEVNGRVRGRRSARLTALTSGGAIPDRADYRVVMDPAEIFVGTLDEDFAIESMPGDIFQLGNTSWQIVRVEKGKVRVVDAHGQPPTIPFWFGEAPARSPELSEAVSRLREDFGAAADPTDMSRDLTERLGIDAATVKEVTDYLLTAKLTLGQLPSQSCIVAERFFDEAGNMHLVIHSPFGSRVNRAWGLSLRKRFCRAFNFELQAAAGEDAIILSLGPTHSFPVDDVFSFLSHRTVRGVLVQALLDAPMFQTRWRWNLNRSLAVPRFQGGKRLPPPIQRMVAEDMLAVVFPDQLACLENIVGEREIPDHPIVAQTIEDCLKEAMDIDGLESLLRRIEEGQITLLAKDVREPSVLAHQILNARPYAFLDPAPLEERRTQAVLTRRGLTPSTASDLGKLDQDAIDRVRDESWPRAEFDDELHDALVIGAFITLEEGRTSYSPGLFEELKADRRAGEFILDGEAIAWIAAERLPQMLAIHSGGRTRPSLVAPTRHAQKVWGRGEAILDIIRGRLSVIGPATSQGLSGQLRLDLAEVDQALIALESEGSIFRGAFDEDAGDELQWCDRRLLARIHRYTLKRLRREISPVSPADFMRFLFSWHRATDKVTGPQGLLGILEQLQGFHAAAAAWESDILPLRVENYHPSTLDQLCLSGQAVWGRLRASGAGLRRPLRSSPLALVPRGSESLWRKTSDAADGVSATAASVLGQLEERGACFFTDLMRATSLLRTQLEESLAELVAAGLVTSDSFSGLRALVTPSARRSTKPGRRSRAPAYTVDLAGRWSILGARDPEEIREEERTEAIAWALLRRWGVVFRKLLVREHELPQWRKLLYVYRRLEARGDIRGGRFVSGFVGEQFALPEAVGKMRAVRRSKASDQWTIVCGSDPLNLTAIVTAGERVSSLTTNRVLYRDGVPVAVLESGQVRFLVAVEEQEEWGLKKALERTPAPPEVRAYLK